MSTERVPLINHASTSARVVSDHDLSLRDVERCAEENGVTTTTTTRFTRVRAIALSACVGAVCVAAATVHHPGLMSTGSSSSFTAMPELGRSMSKHRRQYLKTGVWTPRVGAAKSCDVYDATNASEDREKYWVARAIHDNQALSDGFEQHGSFPPRGVDAAKLHHTYELGLEDVDVERPYRLPLNGYDKGVAQQGNGTMIYNFIHVPKAGGTFMMYALAWLQNRNVRQVGSSVPPGLYAGGPMVPAGMLDTTLKNVFATAYALRTGKGIFANDKVGEAYASGKRLFAKGSYGMGLCSQTNAPCSYLAVLRDPFDRFMSHYKYSCLEGAEGRALWAPEWKYCPLSPLQWYEYLDGDEWTYLFAPGAPASASKCHVDAVKNNLQSACMRYILTEKMDDGLMKLKRHLPDFSDMDMKYIKKQFTNGSAAGMTTTLKQRLANYTSDTESMAELKRRLAHQTEIYDFAVANYEKSWNSPLKGC